MFDYFRDGFWHGIAYWINHHQTLIAGLLALAAGLLTVKKIRDQINQTERHRNDDIERRHFAAKAGMSMALTEISDYCENCLDIKFQVFEYWKSQNNVTNFKAPKLPNYPQGAFDKVQKSIETAATENGEILIDFINEAQIHHSRSTSLFTEANPSHFKRIGRYRMEERLFSTIFDSIRLNSYALRFFDYVRSENDIKGFDSADSAISNFNYRLNLRGIDRDLQAFIKDEWPTNVE